jgi:hypothetical protein
MVMVRNPQLPTFQQVVLGYERVVAVVSNSGGVLLSTLLICARSLISVCISLMIQLSRIQGHEIHIVLYALLDGDDY